MSLSYKDNIFDNCYRFSAVCSSDAEDGHDGAYCEGGAANNERQVKSVLKETKKPD